MTTKGDIGVLPSSPLPYILILTAAVLYGIFERFRFSVAKLLDASVLSTVFTLSTVVSFIGSIVLFGEQVTTQKVLGVLLIIGSIVLVSYQKQKKKISQKGLLLGIGISTLLGIAWLCDKKIIGSVNPNFYQIMVWVFPAIAVYLPNIPAPLLKKEIKTNWKSLSIIAFINVLGYYFQIHALSMADASQVFPLIQITLLLTVLLGIVFLKERDHIAKKIIAGIVAFIGVWFLL